jgi:hypothetical protein
MKEDKPTGSYYMPSGNSQAPQYAPYIGNWWSNGGDPPPAAWSLASIGTPDNTIMLTEHDSDQGGYQGGGNATGSLTTQLLPGHNGLQDWSAFGVTNYTVELHPHSTINHLFVDGHAKYFIPDDPEVIGDTGTWGNPKGAWTVDSTD